MKLQLLALLISLLPLSSFAQLSSPLPKGIPVCYGSNREVLSLDNAGTLKLKTTTPNLYKKQVFVKAKLVTVSEIKENSYGRHLRIIVSLANEGETVRAENLIEISQSLNGYLAPTASDLNGPIYVCGEYSTTDANKEPKITEFEPSITGAMIHWTHAAGPDINVPSPRHPHGWLFVNGKLFGVYNRAGSR